ncbi:DUF5682 family protein [Frankia sp. Ag45/Mut15]|uniref:DUF5682 family protein n=1 Tax=Frankia umida TaxID=573489 RepID=A0ABT0JW15_9ACTN|nr:DUF5682 family protein [Frankia umida]MCK9875514.1 DUF5682 family protein [Frankia umida]
MGVTVLGVRHHGPGSARMVRAALTELAPDLILVEGPPEGNDALTHLGALTPPVALTAYAVDEPRDAAFWPFAEFSPEWQALRYGQAAGVPTRFIDLPFGHDLALRRRAAAETTIQVAAAATPEPRATPTSTDGGDTGGDASGFCGLDLAADPLGWLAFAAGHDDPERFWEDLVEHRRPDTAAAMHSTVPVAGGTPAASGTTMASGTAAVDLFAAVAESMVALREADVAGAGLRQGQDGLRQARDELREAHMRLEIRAASTSADAAQRIAVICGAWHVPALTGRTGQAGRGSVTADRALLRGVRPVRTATTWVPWTHALLATDSGYGAGITSPGWYQHLWAAPDQVTSRWVARVAALLRAADLPASTASAVETVRLAEALAAVRDRTVPGLTELDDAVLAGLCAGDPVPLRVIRERLVIGDVVGMVGPDVPTVPLAADVARAQKRLRLAPNPTERPLRLDLRRDLDRERSALLHRLRLLDVDWGIPAHTSSTGTFAEAWRLAWQPSFALALVSAARHGATVEDAAAAVVAVRIGQAGDLATITELFEQVVLADLPAALTAVSTGLERRAAATGDVAHLMRALTPLARVHRYGDVRGTDTSLVVGLVTSLMTRICAGLPPGCVSLDDDAADAMVTAIDGADAAFTLIAEQDHIGRWHTAVAAVAGQSGGNTLVAGRCTRILSDAGRIDPVELSTRLARALSTAGGAPAEAARWLAGFLGRTGSVLARDPALLALVDSWLCGLAEDDFVVALAPLRRGFAAFSHPERRMIGERVRAGLPQPTQPQPAQAGAVPAPAMAGSAAAPAMADAAVAASAVTSASGQPAGPGLGPATGPAWDFDRVRTVLPTLTILLGLTPMDEDNPHAT